jgi:hypothetical protein
VQTASGAWRCENYFDAAARIAISSAGNVTIVAPSSGVSLTVNTPALGLNLKTSVARGSGSNWLQFQDPTGDKGYIGYGGANDVISIVNQLNAGITLYANNLLRMTIAAAGNVTIAAPSSGYALNLPTNTPASASDTGTTGDISWDTSFFYVCTAANTWKRAPIATW